MMDCKVGNFVAELMQNQKALFESLQGAIHQLGGFEKGSFGNETLKKGVGEESIACPENQCQESTVETGDGDDEVSVKSDWKGHIDTGSGDDKVVIGGQEIADGPVAAKETGRIWGDPHFIGGDGDKYDVQGEAGKTYDLLSDSDLQLRGRFDDFGNGATVVGETGLTVGSGIESDHINFRKDGTASINGQAMEKGVTYELVDGGTARLEEDGSLTVTTAEGYTIKQTANDGTHINIDVSTGEDGVDNGHMPGGLLGQTFDQDKVARQGTGSQGEGAIEGDVSDYECDSLDPLNDGRGSTKAEKSADEAEEPDMETFVDTGSGDDKVEIYAEGYHTVEMGSGDDEAYVSFKDGATNSTASISGGSGDDVVTLEGSSSDYTVSHENGQTIYTDKEGNTIRVDKDVEQVRFEGTSEQADSNAEETAAAA